MKNHNTKTLLVSVACVLFSMYGMQAQAQKLLNYPLDTINGVEVYRYHIEKGIGLYRIGVNFNVSQDVLYRYNPELRNGVKYNQLIFIPTGRPVTESKSQDVLVESKPTVAETPVAVSEPEPVVVDEPLQVVVSEPEPVVVDDPLPVVVYEPAPVVVESKPKSQPVAAAAQPAPAVKKQNIAACRTIVIGPENKDSRDDQSVSTLYIGPDKKDNNRPGELDVIRIGQNNK